MKKREKGQNSCKLLPAATFFFLLRKHYVSKLILKNIKETSSHSFKIPTSYHFHKNANNIYAVLRSMYLPISDIKNKVWTIPLNSKMYIILKVPTFFIALFDLQLTLELLCKMFYCPLQMIYHLHAESRENISCNFLHD